MQEFRRISQITVHVLPKDVDSPADEADQQSLRAFWREYAGIAAPHTRLLWYRSGRLVVFCDSPVWTTQIRHQTPSLIRQLNESGFKISSLEPKTRPAGHIFGQGNRPKRSVNPISAQNARAMIGISRKLTHKELGEAIYRLASKSIK